MTERVRASKRPSIQTILDAIESLTEAYHQFASAWSAHEDTERAERRYLRERLDAIAGHLDRMQMQIDRRFDQVWQELDALKARVDKHEAGDGGH